jgi:hypothetical protein
MHCPDNYDAFCQHEAKQERWLAKLPECSECGEPIQTEFCYEIDGDLYCENCMDCHRICTEKYYRED